MSEDDTKLEYLAFRWYNGPNLRDDNTADLNRLLKDGKWEIDGWSRPVVIGDRLVSFVALIREVPGEKKDHDEDED